MRILVLETASVTAVVRAGRRIEDEHPGADIVIAVTEVEQWKYGDSGFETWTLGEERLPLADDRVWAEVLNRGFDLVLIPVGVPRQALLFVARRVASTPQMRFELDLGSVLRCRRRRFIRLFLVIYSFVVYAPVGIALRLSRAADGALVVGAQVLARLIARWGKGRRREEAGPVCHVITSLGTGGAQRQLIDYVRRAAPSPVPLVTIALFEYNELFVDELEDEGIDVEIIYRICRTSRFGHILGRAFPYSTVFFLLWRRLRRLRPRCTYSWLFTANVVTAPAAFLAGVPEVVSSVRNISVWKTWPQYRHWWYRAADRCSAPLNSVIVGNSQAVANDFATWSGAAPSSMRVIHNGVDEDRLLTAPVSDIRRELGIPEEVLVALTLGRIAYEKNHAMLLRCSAELMRRGRDFRVLIVGHGELEQDLRALCSDLGLERHVHFAGKTDEPQSFYRSADLFVLSSIIEGMPNSLMEAQLFGLPAVTTRSGGSGEVVEDGSTGFVVEVGDEEAFVDRMDRLLKDPQLRSEMGCRAQERMRSEFSIEKMAAAIDRLTGRTVGPG